MTRYDTTAMLEKLVSFDTTSRNSNLALIDWVADYLAGYGIQSELIHNPEKTKANLFATIGPVRDGGIVLSGHTDVVPVDGQPWTADPWTLLKRDGRAYGRGTSDMKSFIAASLAKVPDWAGGKLERPIHLAFSYDEEVGCTGVGGMIDWLRRSGLRPRAAIIGEPTDMKVVTSHKGGIVGTCTVKGVAGHSSQVHRTVNAVMYAAELVAHAAQLGEEMKAGQQDPLFDPPYSTLQVNIMHGGSHGNVVPHECSFFWEHRALPGRRLEDVVDALKAHADKKLLPRMRAVSADTGIDFAVLARIPGLADEPGSEAETIALRLAGRNATEAVAFGTEAGYFQELGIPTVVCGPGNIAQAHKPDEYIALEQLDACDRFLDRLAAECASPARG
ncbi:MAG: acetylornithine deacetylase [Rhodospirillaceae bacterium]|nr:acetylornithine deacetylase [Rhodospirillaceae bacterium]